MLEKSQGGQCRGTLVVGCIVQDQHNWASRVVLDQEVFEKGNETLTVLARRRQPSDGIMLPVVRSKR